MRKTYNYPSNYNRIFSFKNFIIFFGFCVLISCNKNVATTSTSIYFGGEIINPNRASVDLIKSKKFVDAIPLDAENKFLKKYDSLEEGLYRFRPQPESQIVLMEHHDSLLVRVNSIEFDESLVFSGRGARKNNFLIDMFLQNEHERKNYSNHYQLPPDKFLKVTDSLQKIRFRQYQKLLIRVPLSPLAKKVVQNSFVSHYNARKEAYPRRHFGSNLTNARGKFDSLSDAFFLHREKIDLNDSLFNMSYDFSRFLNSYVNNITFMNYAEKYNTREKEPGSTIRKIKLIDSVFTNAYIKNILLRGITQQALITNSDRNATQQILQEYLATSSDSLQMRHMQKLATTFLDLESGDIIPNQRLISSDSTTINLLDVVKRKPFTALYFWSTLDIQYYKRAHAKVAELQLIYPEVQFIAININEEKTKKWINILDKYGYRRENEFQFSEVQKSINELVLFSQTRNKLILLNTDGKIINSKANVFTKEFEADLQKMLRSYYRDMENTTPPSPS